MKVTDRIAGPPITEGNVRTDLEESVAAAIVAALDGKLKAPWREVKVRRPLGASAGSVIEGQVVVQIVV